MQRIKSAINSLSLEGDASREETVQILIARSVFKEFGISKKSPDYFFYFLINL